MYCFLSNSDLKGKKKTKLINKLKLTPSRNVFHTVDILLAIIPFLCSLQMNRDNLCCHPLTEILFLLAPEHGHKKGKDTKQVLSRRTQKTNIQWLFYHGRLTLGQYNQLHSVYL